MAKKILRIKLLTICMFMGAIFSLNTCDGYTKFKDGTKVESVANRIVIFD